MECSDWDFSLDTRVVEAGNNEAIKEAIKGHSRKQYATPVLIVEEEIGKTLGMAHPPGTGMPLPSLKLERKEEQAPILEVKPVYKKEAITSNISPKAETQHRYLQNLIKKMAEAKGYKATLEAVTPDGTGKIDVLLEKAGYRIACEVSVTTDAH